MPSIGSTIQRRALPDRAVIPELLAEDRVARPRLRKPLAQRPLDRVVGLGNRRQVWLGLHRQILGEVALERDRVGDIGQRQGQREVIGHGAGSLVQHSARSGDVPRDRLTPDGARRPAARDDRGPSAPGPVQHGQPARATSARRSSISPSYLEQAGFETELLAAVEDRPNLVATLDGAGDGPTLLYLGHVDTVLADPSEWQHDPWSGDVADGYLWGRGALDMKSQVAAEAVAGAALARGRLAAGARRR